MTKAKARAHQEAGTRPEASERLSVGVWGADAGVRREIRRAARMTLQSEGYRRGTLEVAVVGEAEMRGQHRRWKGSAAVTDVLSFDLRERPRRSLVDGQLIVCGPTARKRAKRRGGDWRGELLLYVVHGCLHLCDYDDATATAAARMHRLEDDLLAALGWGRVFSSGLRKESPRGRSGRRARAGTE